jgi:hypothetical protein
MVDYRRFDYIGDSDDDEAIVPIEETLPKRPSDVSGLSSDVLKSVAISQNPAALQQNAQTITKKGKEGRLKFEYQGRAIYEWEQSLSEVNIYIEMPPGVTRKMLDITISPHHLKVGIKGTQPYIDEETGGSVKVGESTWLISDGEIQISLQKMNKAEAWDCALKGRTGEVIDVHTKEEVKKKLMLERFQEEVSI